MRREVVNKTVRFEVFKRDNFRCAYCGKQPPKTTLVIEHILAVANGGTNSPDNLCTSCFECNRGKGVKLLSDAPPGSLERMAELQERLENLNAITRQSALAKKLDRKTKLIRQDLADFWCHAFGVKEVKKSTIVMIYNRLPWIPILEMKELIECCADKMSDKGDRSQARYMGGILRNRLSKIGVDFAATNRDAQ